MARNEEKRRCSNGRALIWFLVPRCLFLGLVVEREVALLDHGRDFVDGVVAAGDEGVVVAVVVSGFFELVFVGEPVGEAAGGGDAGDDVELEVDVADGGAIELEGRRDVAVEAVEALAGQLETDDVEPAVGPVVAVGVIGRGEPLAVAATDIGAGAGLGDDDVVVGAEEGGRVDPVVGAIEAGGVDGNEPAFGSLRVGGGGGLIV
jgi:hypothetical protein